ncbi:MAG: hypothetical protein JWM48_2096 [Mycobacterium sp.]|jgi:hypothetical protein|nr:hypothetical protein [Mycobacterium sp.]MCW2745546.1 hypothetical protein [Mycobacterium sp.]
MAKALFGHVGMSADHRLVDEVATLRRRVADLQQLCLRLQAENDALVAAARVPDDLSHLADSYDDEVREPAFS